MHRICVLYLEHLWPSGFMCDNCRNRTCTKRQDNKFVAKRLPPTKLGTYLEMRVNSMLKRKDAGAGEVTIRVLSSYDKAVDVKPGMRSRFGDTADKLPYRVKAMFAFEEIEGVDVCFFGMHVQEYGSDCPPPNTRRVYIAYLDSVYFFQPRMFRTAVYHEILIGYMDYVKSLGFLTAHIWACPPSEGDDYIFHCHPPEQKIPKPKRLQEWYRKMLDKAMADRVICDYKDILKDAVENNLTSVTEMPYFEGDFWPNIIEESIKEVEQEELEQRRREEEEAAADTDDGESNVHGDNVELQPFAGKKKGQKSGNTKKKNSKCKKQSSSRKSKTGGSDLTGKLLSTMEKHKEGFFVIRLQPNAPSGSSDLADIKDPDPLINCDLMDGRDAFLTMSRDKHYEFSSLRRAKYSTAGMLHELHNQARDSFAYVCNACKASVETRYHCTTCDDFDLCVTCYKSADHPHRMVKLGLDLDDGSAPPPAEAESAEGDTKSTAAVAEARRQSYAQLLAHTSHCRNANCVKPGCRRMRGLVTHMHGCERKQACPTCRQMLLLCWQHARTCTEARCPVPFCPRMREKQERRRREQLFQQQQLVRRRVANMQRSAYMASVSEDCSTDSATVPTPGEQHASEKSQHVSGKSPPTGSQMTAVHTGGGGGQRPVNNAVLMHQHMSRMMSGNMDSGWPGSFPSGQANMTPGVPDDMYQQKHGVMSNEMSSAHLQQAQSMMQSSQQPAMKNPSPALQKLLETLHSPTSPHQQQEVQHILKSNPDVMATAIKQRQFSQHLSTSLNSQMMSGGSIMGQIRSPVAGMQQQQQQQHMNVAAMTPSNVNSPMNPALAGGPAANGPMTISQHGVMVPGAAGPAYPGGPGGLMESVVDETGRQVMMSQNQMRMMWVQQQQQQQQMLRGGLHAAQYGRFPTQHRSTGPYCGTNPMGLQPQSQRLRMTASVGATPMPAPYPNTDAVRGLGPVAGTVASGQTMVHSQQQQMMQMTQRRAQQLRGMAPSSVQQPMFVDTSRSGNRRAPPPHYADTVLAHSTPRPVSSVAGDQSLGQFSDPRMRFKPAGADFPTAAIPATDVVRYPGQHDPTLSRFGEGQGST